MRVQLIFDLDKSIPLEHRLGILAIIKEMVHQGSASYYEDVFINNRYKMKPFSYGIYISNLQISKKQIFGDSLQLTLSSPDYAFIMHFMNGSKKGETYYIKNSPLMLKAKRLLPTTKITSNIAVFKTMSPIHIEDKQQKPLLATDEHFNLEIEFLTKLILHEVYHRVPSEPIKVLQTMMKKQVIKENIHQKQEGPLYLTANKGLIQLQGNPIDLQCIYDAGLSMRRSLGFGLIELVEGVN